MSHATLQGCSILVVEDDFYLAEDMLDALSDAGAMVIGPVADIDGAMTMVEGQRPDLAVLDVNLGADTSFEFGRMLKSRGIPILFATGYDPSIIPPDLADAGYLIKPVNMARLVATLIDARD